MTELSGQALLDTVRAIAERAAGRVLEVYGSDFEVTRKADRSPLTEADLASHRTIVEGLREATPAIPVLSEESADEAGFAVRSGWNRYWLVDPLDGTKHFVKRDGKFTVNVALVEDHAPVLGVVTVPVSGVSYAAARGLGARRYDGSGSGRGAPISVRASAAHPLRVAASQSHTTPETEAFIRALGPVRRISTGSSLKLCMVAEGEVDVYPRFGPTGEWDTAAAQCVVEEAGGRVTGVGLEPLRYNTGESLLNPHFLAFGDRTVDWTRFMAPAAGG